MAIHKLTPRQIAALKDGMLADGGGLYVQGKHGGKSGIFRFFSPTHKRERYMGLGSLDTYAMDELREKARQCRQQVAEGIDPIDARQAQREDQQLARAKEKTVAEVAREWMDKNSVEWVQTTADIIKRRFELYVLPKIGTLPIQRFDTEIPHSSVTQLLHDVLDPIWQKRPTTGEVVRQHLDGVLQWAAAKRYISRTGGGAASMESELFRVLLPKQETFKEVKHHRAIPYTEIGAFMADLRARMDSEAFWKGKKNQQGARKRGARRPHAVDLIEFTVLTAVRKGQAVFAKWGEIDFDAKLWRSSQHKTRKKVKLDHVIPLSNQAMVVLERMKKMRTKKPADDDFIFAAAQGFKGHMSKTAVNKFLHVGMGRTDISIHGFRTAFKTWAIESGYPDTDSEMALAHVIGGKTRNAYIDPNHGRIEPRRLMMQAWADFCDRTEPVAGVVPMAAFRSARAKKEA
jgi:integrase